MKLKPQCGWCKNHDEFQENTQLRIAVTCFKKLCEYISDSPIGEELQQTPSPNGETESNNLTAVLQDALDFEDNFQMSHCLTLPKGLDSILQNKHSPSKTKSSTKSSKKSEQSVCSSNFCTNKSKSPGRADHDDIGSQKHTSSDVSFLCSTPRNMEETDTELRLNSTSQSDESIEVDVTDTDTSIDSQSDLDKPQKRKRESESSNKLIKSSSCASTGSQGSKGDNSQSFERDMKRRTLGPDNEQKEIKICKCGRGGTNSRLTCLGQRCPCYIKKLPCIGCKCKGCRNPRKVDHDLEIIKAENTSGIDCMVNSENMFVNV